MARSFFDTNVLVYTDDPNNRDKALIGTRLVEQHLLRGEAVLSTQVLQEYFVTTPVLYSSNSPTRNAH